MDTSIIKSSALLLFTTLFTGFLSANNFQQQVRFDRYSTEDGLPQGVISSIIQDQEGFIWVSTHDGMAQFDGYNFKIFQHNPKDSTSLPGNLIGLIREGQHDNIWVFLGRGGITRFDKASERSQYYYHNPENSHSLSGNTITSYLKTQDGIFWFGTRDGGVSRYNPGQENFTSYTVENGLSSNVVNDIIQDASGNIWVGTAGRGLNKITTSGEIDQYMHHTAKSNSLNDNTVHTFYIDSRHQLWIATANGVCRYRPESDDFIRLANLVKHQTVPIPKYVYRLYGDLYGNLWMVTTSGLYRFNPMGNDLHLYLSADSKYTVNARNQITAFCEDSLQQLWIGSNTGGLFRYDRTEDTLYQYLNHPGDLHSLSNNNISTILSDRSGSLWIGTVGGGINKYSYKKRKFNSKRFDSDDDTGLPNTGVTAIYQHHGFLWIGTNKRGLFRYNESTGEYRNYLPGGKRIAGNTVTLIYPARDGNLWIGTITEGLNYFNISKEKFTHFPASDAQLSLLNSAHINSICQTNDGMLWIGTGTKGLGRYNPRTQKIQYYQHDPQVEQSLSSNTVLSIYEDSQGVLWVGTASGLSRFQKAKDSFVNYQHIDADSTSLDNRTITALYEDQHKNFWVGTYSGGLNKLDRSTGTFSSFTKNDGLAGNRISGILEDTRGNLWISTNHGISKFNPNQETFTNYDASDGLQGDEFGRNASYKATDGRMYFGGSNGYSYFYPENVKQNHFIPPVRITALKIFNKTTLNGYALPTENPLTLSYKKNFFGFEFAALDFTNPGKNRYAYKMDGFDKHWIKSGTRHYATYTNLDGGTYTFRVRGSNNDGKWNEAGVSIPLVITPPFWRRTWFRILTLLLLIGLGYAWYKLRIRRIQSHNRELQKEIQERKQVEKALAEERHRLNVTLRSIGDGVIATDTAGKIVLINREAEKYTGWPGDEAVGRSLTTVFNVVDEKNEQPAENPVTKVLQTNRYVNLSNHSKLISKDGHEYIIADSGAPIMDNEGEIQGVVLVFRDMTEKRKMEEEISKAEKFETIGVLAGGIAHDFNNILSAIIGNIYLAKTELSPDDQVYQRLTEVENASSMATDLTAQLLTFSKGGVPVKETASLGKIIQDSATFVLRGSNVRPEFDIASDLWQADVDVGQFSQVINNLVINADHAMPEGGIIQLSAKNIALDAQQNIPLEAGKYVQVTIQDYGIGIPAEHLDKIFDPYFTTKSHGSGLGLASSYSIIKRHDGHIAVESVPGKGTAFSLYLPASVQQHSEQPVSRETIQKGSGKILVMDDEKIIQSLASEMLKHLGYNVDIANDGEEAIAKYKHALENSDPFNAVIMDLTIPGGMGGKEAIKVLKNIDPNIRAIVSSGYFYQNSLDDFSDLGFVGMISKPYKMEALASELYRVTTE